ncbi:hypothetical protein A2783_01695 [Microgenomates group bacterium RIFCSPHIGHO2_01_FULL_45_11]|nr:MAG: hypothetical protein A2783_01695 [Microgenomates group bacterium RIFCSPHIGHO2_01_FULL_45_11]
MADPKTVKENQEEKPLTAAVAIPQPSPETETPTAPSKLPDLLDSQRQYAQEVAHLNQLKQAIVSRVNQTLTSQIQSHPLRASLTKALSSPSTQQALTDSIFQQLLVSKGSLTETTLKAIEQAAQHSLGAQFLSHHLKNLYDPLQTSLQPLNTDASLKPLVQSLETGSFAKLQTQALSGLGIKDQLTIALQTQARYSQADATTHSQKILDIVKLHTLTHPNLVTGQNLKPYLQGIFQAAGINPVAAAQIAYNLPDPLAQTLLDHANLALAQSLTNIPQLSTLNPHDPTQTNYTKNLYAWLSRKGYNVNTFFNQLKTQASQPSAQTTLTKHQAARLQTTSQYQPGFNLRGLIYRFREALFPRQKTLNLHDFLKATDLIPEFTSETETSLLRQILASPRSAISSWLRSQLGNITSKISIQSSRFFSSLIPKLTSFLRPALGALTKGGTALLGKLGVGGGGLLALVGAKVLIIAAAAVLIALAVILLVYLIQIQPQSAAQIHPVGPVADVAFTPDFAGCTQEKQPLDPATKPSNPIAARAWEITSDLYQGFWCFWNRSPGDFPTDTTTYLPNYPDLFNENLFATNPNPPRRLVETSASNLFWCTQLVVKAYQETGGNLPRVVYLSSTMQADFTAARRFIPAANITPQNAAIGSVIFFRVESGPPRTNHVAIIANVSSDAVVFIQSNAPTKTGSLSFNDSGQGLQNLPGIIVEGIGLP